MDSYHSDNCIVNCELCITVENWYQIIARVTVAPPENVHGVLKCLIWSLYVFCLSWLQHNAKPDLHRWRLCYKSDLILVKLYLQIAAAPTFEPEQLHPAQGHPHLLFVCLQESKFSVSCPTSLGKLVLIEVDKKPLPLFPEDAWFPCKFKVKSPEGDIYNFPIYRWISDTEVHIFREGTGLWNCTCLLHYFQTSQILIL